MAASGDAQGESGGSHALAQLLKDVAWLVADLAADSRIPGRTKAIGAGGLALAAWPRAPLPAPQSIARVAAGWWSVRHLVRAAGYAVVYEHWRGTDEGLALVLALAGVED